uniref:Unannotated protein n=1 Tax=freshwater metagenome TaxID=449393 RepID=A0A6J7NYC9_9ZZZZ
MYPIRRDVCSSTPHRQVDRASNGLHRAGVVLSDLSRGELCNIETASVAVERSAGRARRCAEVCFVNLRPRRCFEHLHLARTVERDIDLAAVLARECYPRLRTGAGIDGCHQRVVCRCVHLHRVRTGVSNKQARAIGGQAKVARLVAAGHRNRACVERLAGASPTGTAATAARCRESSSRTVEGVIQRNIADTAGVTGQATRGTTVTRAVAQEIRCLTIRRHVPSDEAIKGRGRHRHVVRTWCNGCSTERASATRGTVLTTQASLGAADSACALDHLGLATRCPAKVGGGSTRCRLNDERIRAARVHGRAKRDLTTAAATTGVGRTGTTAAAATDRHDIHRSHVSRGRELALASNDQLVEARAVALCGGAACSTTLGKRASEIADDDRTAVAP